MTALPFPGQERIRPDLNHGPGALSFYHLDADGVRGKCCQGLACFVARHSNCERWKEASHSDKRVYCLGKCFIAPAAAEDRQRPAKYVHARDAVVLRGSDYHGLQAAVKLTPEEVIAELEKSGLRGRGGAGFPTGKKWRACAQQPSAEKHIVANADEGDPGSYVDRFIMEDNPHSLIEGMLIAAYAVGANRGVIYLRCEYPEAGPILRRAIEEAASRCTFPFTIELSIGRGSYLCGEETAMLNSIEGKRPFPRTRPPYCTEHGLYGQSTVVNNVETLATVPWILEHGGERYRQLGFSKSRGTKVLSLNSLFNRPGLHEVEFGVTVRDIVERFGGGLRDRPPQGVIIGGPLAGIIPPHLFDTRFGFEELHAIGAGVGHGGVVAFDERTSIPELVNHVFSFGAYESCGLCNPCRLGTARIEEMFSSPGNGSLREFKALVANLKLASFCGHGTGLAEFAESVLRYYEKELAAWFK